MHNQSSLLSLEGKTVLITGAASGIGQHLCQVYAQYGGTVIAQGRNTTALEATCNMLAGSGHRHITGDLLHIKDWDEFVTDNQLQSVDIVANAAGVNLRQPWEDITDSSWDETLNIHLKVPFFLSRALVPHMKKKHWGRVINFASLQSVRAFDNSIPYGAAKGGTPQLTRAMAQAWSKYGINCNAIAPGFFPTQLTKPVFDNPAISEQRAKQTAIGRNGEFGDLDGLSLLFASSASDYITGQVVFVDGGFTAS